jgi:hypothetical protein
VPNGGGVLATGNASFVGTLANAPLIPPNVVPESGPAITGPMLRMIENLYSVIAMGPAGAVQPSQGTWRTYYGSGSVGSKAPNTDNTA